MNSNVLSPNAQAFKKAQEARNPFMPKKFIVDTQGRTNKTCRQESLHHLRQQSGHKVVGSMNDKNLSLALDKLMSDFDKKTGTNRYHTKEIRSPPASFKSPQHTMRQFGTNDYSATVRDRNVDQPN